MIRDILLMQKQELETKLHDIYIERTSFMDTGRLENPLIKVIIGPRRAGKSFFAIHFLRRHGLFGYVNFDDERLVETKDYDEILANVDSIYSSPKYLLFDEIQNLPKWELFVNRLQRQGYNLVLTGSNSNLLSRELATHLTGRHLPIHIFPFSFAEIMQSENRELASTEIKAKLEEYVLQGGYPEPFIKHMDQKEYLRTLFTSVIFKDIVKRHRIRYAKGLENLATYLLSNIAKEFSYTNLSQVTQCRGIHTVEKYISYLEETFLFFTISRFSFKAREQMRSNKKIYCIDNGFITAMAFSVSADNGRRYENAVAIELKKQELAGELSSLHYWKNPQQEEVDFVIRKGTEIKQLVQVCYELNQETKKREIRALLKASRELGCDELLVINSDYEGEETAEWFGIKGRIRFIPLWKWLLKKEER